MAVAVEKYRSLQTELTTKQVTLVVVSKLKPAADIQSLYNEGHRHFGENYVQELVVKQAQLPNDIQWHFIGHLQSNKVKYIAPFVHIIHGIDSLKLLQEVNKQAAKNQRIIQCLLQVHIATEDTKHGMNASELATTLDHISNHPLPHVQVVGLMGMASFTDNTTQLSKEFSTLQQLYQQYQHLGFNTLSMGMSGDYELAISHGSNMVRIGSLLFGHRS